MLTKKGWRWTKEQIDFLKKHYHQKFLKDMLNLELFKNKTFTALNCECWRLGLKRSQKGKHNHNWKGGRRKDRGYIKLFGQYDCPYANENGTIREHIFVWWKYYGDKDPILYGEVIHHINGNKTDNRIENLKKMKKWEHDRLSKKNNLKGGEVKNELPRNHRRTSLIGGRQENG